jgi:hypothetical protein
MKTRKLLPLILLAVGALFALTSCDALLDLIFATNQISVDVRVNDAYVGVYTDWVYDTATVQVKLYDSSGLYKVATSNSVDRFGGYVHFYLTFSGLKDDTYHLIADYDGTYGGSFSDFRIFDTHNAEFISGSIKMPYDDSLQDVTGHSVELRMYL